MSESADYIDLPCFDDAPEELRELLSGIFTLCADLSARIASAGASQELGAIEAQNVQGEQQKLLDVIANDLFVERLLMLPMVAGVASEEMEEPVWAEGDQGQYLVIFDPLDGSSNIGVNISVGSIFSILHIPSQTPRNTASFLQSGQMQIAAAYAIYGPNCQVVYSVGNGTHALAWSPEASRFVLNQARMRIDGEAHEYAINGSNRRHWLPPILRYIEECEAGVEGPRQRDFNMRWVASMVAEIHRILNRGGVFLYPEDTREPRRPGKLRLMYEANPMALLVEQAHGDASNGTQRIMTIEPRDLHQRVAVVMGAASELKRIKEYHQGA